MRTLLVSLVVLAAPSSAFAALSVTATPATVTVASVTLSGDDKTATFTESHTVTNTGAGNTAGWNLQVSSALPTSGTKTLPAIQVTKVTSATCTTGGCVNPANSITWPVTLVSTGAKVFNAAVGTGTGKVVLTATYQLAYPANALPGIYTATMTVAVTAGP